MIVKAQTVEAEQVSVSQARGGWVISLGKGALVAAVSAIVTGASVGKSAKANDYDTLYSLVRQGNEQAAIERQAQSVVNAAVLQRLNTLETNIGELRATNTALLAAIRGK